MNIVSGELFFNREIKNVYPYISKNLESKIGIIGGGVSGLITAYILAKAGYKVVVIEKNILGHTLTMADIGIVDMDTFKLYGYIDAEECKKIRTIYDGAMLELYDIFKELNLDEKDLAIKQIYNNKFMQKSNLQKNARLREKLGEENEVLDSVDKVKSCNNISFRKKVIVLNTYEFVQKLAELLVKKYHVKIYENTEIKEVNPNYDFVECITNNNFVIKLEKLIYCTGIDFYKEYNLDSVELMQKFVIVTKPILELQNEERVLNNFSDNSKIRITSSGRVIYEGEETKCISKMQDENYFSLLQKEKFTKLTSNINKIIDVEEFLNAEYCYSYILGKTKDRLPIIDEIECMDNCFCNLSFGENSILSSIVGANMLKNAINGFFTKEMRFFRINRFNCN